MGRELLQTGRHQLRPPGQSGEDDGGREATTGEPIAEPVASARQATPHRPHRPMQPVRGFLVGQTFEIAGDERRPVGRGDPIELLVQRRSNVGPLDAVPGGIGGLRRNRLLLDLAAMGGFGLRPQGDPQRDAVQPAAQGVAIADRAGPAHQNQEGGLERILDVVRVAEDAPADVQHHRPVADHQLLEGRLGLRMMDFEPLQQLAIRPISDAAEAEECTNLPERGIGPDLSP